MPAQALAQRVPTQATGPAESVQSVSTLAVRWLAARAASDEAWDRHSVAESASCALAPNYPDDCRAFDDANRREFAAARAAGEAAAQLIAQRPRPASYYLWQAQRDALDAAHGLPHLEQAGRQAADTTRWIRDELLAEPAHCLADLAAKVAVLALHLKEEDIEEEEVADAIAALDLDLQSMLTSQRRG